MVGNAGAQMYDDEQYGYDNHPKKSSHTDIQKIKCVNSNTNVNGIDITQVPQDGAAAAAASRVARGRGAARCRAAGAAWRRGAS